MAVSWGGDRGSEIKKKGTLFSTFEEEKNTFLRPLSSKGGKVQAVNIGSILILKYAVERLDKNKHF